VKTPVACGLLRILKSINSIGGSRVALTRKASRGSGRLVIGCTVALAQRRFARTVVANTLKKKRSFAAIVRENRTG
jgi:hypothetical protein